MSFSCTINQNIIEMEYAVRGAIPQKAALLKKQGRSIIFCNIGNPQALGQNPISFYRHVLSLVEDPSCISRERTLKNYLSLIPKDIRQTTDVNMLSDYILDLSESILSRMETGMGAYTDSKGPLFIREAIAGFIDSRDRVQERMGVYSDPEQIFLTNGASEGAKYIIEMLISGPKDGIMVPIPQYPLYSATIKKCDGVQVNYYPDEESGWVLDKSILQNSLAEAEKKGIRVKGIVVINPANPTGAILNKQCIKEVIEFAEKHNLSIIADEVYQDNMYGEDFHSFSSILGSGKVPLFSLHSTSKGFYGECGHRGGYLEVRNPPGIKNSHLGFMDILVKQASVSLCSNTVGQVLTYLMVSPPETGSEPYEYFIAEKEAILRDLYKKASMIKEAFTQMDHMKCFGKIGAMYLFPRMENLPPGTTDFDYCMNLLDRTGICTVNGSGFGQKKGTNHLRIAFLPPRDLLEKVLPLWIDFHNDYVK